MSVSVPRTWLCRCSCLGVLASGVLAEPVRAQDWRASVFRYFLSSQSITSRSDPLGGEAKRDDGANIGGFLLYPRVFVGGVYDSNPYQTSRFEHSAFGLRLRPAFDLVRETGMQNTLISAQADARLFNDPARDVHGRTMSASTLAGRVDVTHVYEMQRDLVFRFEGSAFRTRDLVATELTSSFSPVRPETTSQLRGAVSVEKTFNRMFAALGLRASQTRYEASDDTPTLSRGSSRIEATGRLGYKLGPDIYAFIEPTLSTGRYDGVSGSAQGDRLVAGLGATRLSLFSGEIFAGRQEQRFGGGGARVRRFVAGARVSWHPTVYIVMSAQLDWSLSLGVTSPLSPGATPAGVLTPGVATTSLVQATYRMDRGWSVAAKAGNVQTTYIGLSRVDQRWLAAATLTYALRRNWALTADYEFSRLRIGGAALRYSENVVSVGVTYRY